MNRLLVVVLLIVVCVVGAGFYFGYFRIGSWRHPAGDFDGQLGIGVHQRQQSLDAG